MKAIFLANIGNSDIGKNRKSLFTSRGQENNVYEKTKEIYEKGGFDDLDAIILEPIISEVKKDYEIKKIYLFATEQDPINIQDTKYSGKIIKEILKKKFGFKDEIFKERIINRNPSDYDEVLKYYQDEINTIVLDKNINNVFFSITGGIPAQNTSLLLEVASNFGLKAQAIYVSRYSGVVKKYKIGEIIYKNLLTQRVEELEKMCLYDAAANLSEQFDLKKPNEIKWLRAKASRDLFDFDRSLSILNEIKDSFSEPEKNECLKEIADIEKVKDKKDMKALIKELYENMKRRWEQGAYADFIGRLFRFEEAVLRFIVEREYKISTDINEKGDFPIFVTFIKDEKNAGLKNFLARAKINIENPQPNRKTLYYILRYIITQHNGDSELENVGFVLGKIENLGEIRNKSILAHGFDGVSKEKIVEKYKSDELMKDIEKIVNFIQNKY